MPYNVNFIPNSGLPIDFPGVNGMTSVGELKRIAYQDKSHTEYYLKENQEVPINSDETINYIWFERLNGIGTEEIQNINIFIYFPSTSRQFDFTSQPGHTGSEIAALTLPSGQIVNIQLPSWTIPGINFRITMESGEEGANNFLYAKSTGQRGWLGPAWFSEHEVMASSLAAVGLTRDQQLRGLDPTPAQGRQLRQTILQMFQPLQVDRGGPPAFRAGPELGPEPGPELGSVSRQLFVSSEEESGSEEDHEGGEEETASGGKKRKPKRKLKSKTKRKSTKRKSTKRKSKRKSTKRKTRRKKF